MKRSLTLFLFLFTFLTLATPGRAADFVVDGIYYDIISGTDNQVKVTSSGNTEDKYSGSVVIPTTVTNGGTYSVTAIGSYAFDDCSGLTSVTIPNSVTTIGSNAFSGCSGLTSVTIGNSVTSIGNTAFSGCSSLTSVEWNAINCQNFNSNNRPFYDCEKITAITFGDKVEHIPAYLCYECSGLTSVTIPENVTSIGNYAFYDCSGLTSVEWNAINCQNFTQYYSPFPSGLTSITFGDKVEHIPAYLCEGCSGLTSVTIGEGVTSIGNKAFFDCSGLTSVQWNAINCDNFTSSSLTPFPSRLTSITIGDKVESIPAYLCYNQSDLTSITIPNSVTSIGKYAFYFCIGLTSVTIPNSVTSIGKSAFEKCEGLTSITIPDGVTSIGDNVFQNCTGLTSVTIGNGVTSIGMQAFSGCRSLTSVTIPNSVTSIGIYAFNSCSSLTSVTIPNSVTSIDYGTFSGCSGLTSVTSLATTPPSCSSEAFPFHDTLYVPCGSKTAYQTATGWKNFNEIIGLDCEDVVTDTLYFEFALVEGETSGTLEYEFSPTILSSIMIDYYDGQEHEKFTPGALGNITVNGNGHGRIYYTYEGDARYRALLSPSGNSNHEIFMQPASDIRLTSLDVHACPGLRDLTCSDNQLTSLNVRGCTNLESLYCSHNELTSLNIGDCVALKDLLCINNQLSTLDVSANTGLESLHCGSNHLTTLDLSNNTYLERLRCDNNHIPLSTLYNIYTQRESWLMFYAEGQTDTVMLEACEALNLASEKTLGGTATTYTFTPNIASSAYTEDDFSFTFNEPFTGTLTLQNNNVPGASFTYHITAEECSVEPPTPPTTTTDTIWFAIKPGSMAGRMMEISVSASLNGNVRVKWVLDEGLQEERTLEPNHSCIQEINSAGYVFLYHSYEQTSDYTYSVWFNPSGRSSDISVKTNDFIIDSLDISACSALGDFSYGGRYLFGLNVGGITSLTRLFCRGQLTALDARGCSALKDLRCSGNQLTSLDVSGCSALTYLDCYNNQLTTLDVSGCSSLTNLYCDDNQLTSLDVSTNTALEYLRCNNNQLTSLDVSNCTDLYDFRCDHNHLTTLDVSNNTVLTYLQCYNNQLPTLEVSDNTELVQLKCQNNHIPLSTLYNIYTQGENWASFIADPQTDTITVSECRPWDLSSEGILDGTTGTYVLKDEEGNAASAGAYNENGFIFQLNAPFKGTLTLQNQGLRNIQANTPDDVVTMTYHVRVSECLTVEVVSNNEAWGWATKTGNGKYEKDSAVTIIATPAEGYRFVNWTKGSEEFSLNAVHTFAVTENISLVAVFEKIPEVPVPPVVDSFAVAVSANNTDWGMAFMTGNGKYEKDSMVTIIATPRDGYRFVNWTKDGEVFSIYAVYTFAVTEDIALIANFEKIPEVPVPPVGDEFIITLTPNNPEWGRVFKTGNCVYGEGDEITILALPFAGYRFVNWTKADGTVFGTDSLITFKVTENLELVANFEEIPEPPVPPVPVRDTFSVQVFSNNEAWGSVSQSGDGRYEKDSLVTITATPVVGYRFVGWTKDDAVFCGQADTTFAVTEDLDLTAHFEKIPDETKPNEDFYIYVKDGVIHLSEDRGRVEVFNAIGQCLYRGRTTTLRVRQTGVYLICIADKTYKVLVM